MEVMGAKPGFDTSFSSHHGIVRALDQKRRMLDLEIERFVAMKEDEYKQFEKQLRSPTKSERGFDCSSPEHVERNTGIQNSTSKLDRSEQPSYPVSNRDPSTNHSDPPLRSLTPLSYPSNLALSPSKDNSRPPISETATTPRNRPPSLQGISTPTYLPLLDANPRSPRVLTPQSSPLSTEVPLSSSATLPATVFSPLISPSQNPPISSSAPRPDSFRNRRSSSRSDISLRSSMRGPKSPRSPKHVLFSIDNVVMSPSTSPETERKRSQSSNKEGKKRRNSTSSTKSRGVETAVGLRDGRNAAPQVPSIINYQDLIQTRPTGKSFGKDIGLVEKPTEEGLDGALFAFDEDLEDSSEDAVQGRGRGERRKKSEKVGL